MCVCTSVPEGDISGAKCQLPNPRQRPSTRFFPTFVIVSLFNSCCICCMMMYGIPQCCGMIVYIPEFRGQNHVVFFVNVRLNQSNDWQQVFVWQCWAIGTQMTRRILIFFDTLYIYIYWKQVQYKAVQQVIKSRLLENRRILETSTIRSIRSLSKDVLQNGLRLKKVFERLLVVSVSLTQNFLHIIYP